MKINAFKFYLKEAGRNVFHNGWMGVASIFTIFCCLVMFGVFLSITMNANHIIEQVQADYDIPVKISGTKTHEELNAIAEKIKNIEGVASVTVVTKEEGLEIAKGMLKGYEGLLDGLDQDNPLRHIVNVNLTDLTNADEIIANIKKVEGIEEIDTRYELRGMIIKLTNFVKHSSIWVMLILVIISVFIISNTIKLAVFTRRKEINIMKFVGATDWFIRWPFLIEGILIGLIGCIFAFGAIWGGYAFADTKVATLDIVSMMPFNQVWPLLLAAFILLSTVLGALGSFISIRKHLKV